MKRTIPSWFFLAAAVLLLAGNLFTLVQLGHVKSQLDTVNSVLWQAEERLNDRIGSIHRDVRGLLKEEASLLAQVFPVHTGNPDFSSLSVPVVLSFVPKTVTASTQASLSYGGQTVPCIRDGNRFTATLMLPLGQELVADQGIIALEEGGTSHLEAFPDGWWFSSRALLPSLNGGGQSGSFGQHGDLFSIQMNYEVWGELPSYSVLRNGRCRILLDGQLWKEIPVEMEGTENNGEDSLSIAIPISIQEEIPMTADQDLDILFVADDNWGVEYRLVLEHLQSGEPQYDAIQEFQIFLPDGSLLFNE